MSQVVACDNDTLFQIAGRLRRVAQQVQSRGTSFPENAAFAGSNGNPNNAFHDLCNEAAVARDTVAHELTELAGAIENAARSFVQVDQALATSLGGFTS